MEEVVGSDVAAGVGSSVGSDVGFVVGSSENLTQVEVNRDKEEGDDYALNCGNLRAFWSEADIINCNVSCVV